jgi:hypothetical protein
MPITIIAAAAAAAAPALTHISPAQPGSTRLDSQTNNSGSDGRLLARVKYLIKSMLRSVSRRHAQSNHRAPSHCAAQPPCTASSSVATPYWLPQPTRGLEPAFHPHRTSTFPGLSCYRGGTLHPGRNDSAGGPHQFSAPSTTNPCPPMPCARLPDHCPSQTTWPTTGEISYAHGQQRQHWPRRSTIMEIPNHDE